MSATTGLAASQFRALGITVGALYAFFTVRGVLTRLSLRAEVAWEPTVISVLAWTPGVLALFAFVGNRIDLGRRALVAAAITYPLAVLLWPIVAVRDAGARVDFWIHSMPGLAAIARKRKLISVCDNTFASPWIQRPRDQEQQKYRQSDSWDYSFTWGVGLRDYAAELLGDESFTTGFP